MSVVLFVGVRADFNYWSLSCAFLQVIINAKKILSILSCMSINLEEAHWYLPENVAPYVGSTGILLSHKEIRQKDHL
jgi:hypothetical protein